MDPDALRSLVRASVAAHHPVDDREARSITAFLTAFDHLDRPFDEEADPVHVTGSAIVVGRLGVVLHLHKRLGIWLQPGGHVDPGEAPWEAALREAEEETGLPVTWPSRAAGLAAGGAAPPALLHVDVHPGPRGHTHLDLRYLVEAAAVPPAPGPGESQDVKWFTWDDACAAADDGLVGGLAAARAALGV